MRSNLTPGRVKQGAKAVLDEVSKSDKRGIVTAVGQALIFGIFALFDELVVDTNFKCPCISPNASAEDEETSCEAKEVRDFRKRMEKLEGDVLLIKAKIEPASPASGASSDGGEQQAAPDGASSKQPTRVTWPCTKNQCKLIFIQFFVVAAAWMSNLCIDGDYIACASTRSPYGNASCADVRKLPYDQLPFSKKFLRLSRRTSQTIGIVLGITVAIVILTSAVPRGVKCKKGPWKKGNICAFQSDVEQASGSDTQDKPRGGDTEGRTPARSAPARSAPARSPSDTRVYENRPAYESSELRGEPYV